MTVDTLTRDARRATPAGLEPRLAGGLEPVSLAALDAHASLQTRVDRKYFVPLPLVDELLAAYAARLRVLDIDGRRSFGYRSVYFDTPDLDCFRRHKQGQRRRFKVRTRTYRDSGLCRLEVKGKGARSETIKKSVRYDSRLASWLTQAARQFVVEQLELPGAADGLRPTLDTRYQRTTVLDRASGSRATFDTSLAFNREGRIAASTEDAVLVETKSEGAAGPLDRWLWGHGVRPEAMSKYCLGVAMLYPEVRANPWHRILRRHFAWEPAAS